eukprot:9636524-Ditylum_brightwellii.AAC.1
MKYPEIFMDLEFVPVYTLSMKSRSGIGAPYKSTVEYGTYVGAISDVVHKRLNLEPWHQYSNLKSTSDGFTSKSSVQELKIC